MPSETQTAKIKWHPVKVKPHIVTAEDLKGGLRTYADVGEKIFLPDNPPPETKVYLVTCKKKKASYVFTDCYDITEGTFENISWKKITAWAELPEPYEPPPPLDMHPDAVYAREFMENEWKRRLSRL